MSVLVLALFVLAAVYLLVWGVIPRLWHRRRKGWRHYGTHAALLAVVAFAGSGCMNTASVVKAMGESNASLSVRIRSVYGTVEVVRLNPSTNTPPHSLSADGTLSVKPAP